MQKVCNGVMPLDRVPTRGINNHPGWLAPDIDPGNWPFRIDLVIERHTSLCRVSNVQQSAIAQTNLSMIPDLSAHLGVERRFIQDCELLAPSIRNCAKQLRIN